MPKQLYKITQFHGGLNSNSDARDIAENELSEATDVMVDELGKIRMMGGTTTGVTANTAAINPGYGLFQFSHDRTEGEEGSGTSSPETGDDYLAMADEATSQIDIYSRVADAWGTGILDLGSETSDMQPTFFVADGALRVSDGNYAVGRANETQWYGYIRRRFLGNGSLGLDDYGHTNGLLIRKWHVDDAAPKALSVQNWKTSQETAVYGDASNPISIVLNSQSINHAGFPGTEGLNSSHVSFDAIVDINSDETIVFLASGSSVVNPGIDNFLSIGDVILMTDTVNTALNNIPNTVVAIDAGSTNIITVTTDLYTTDPDTVVIHNLSRQGWFTGLTVEKSAWYLAISTLYDDSKQESPLSVTTLGVAKDPQDICGGAGASAVGMAQVSFTAYVYAGDGSSTGIAQTDPRVTGFNIYMRRETEGTWYQQANIDITKGIKLANESTYTMWNTAGSNDNGVATSNALTAPLEIITYEDSSGMTSIQGTNQARTPFEGSGTGFKTAVVANRRAYVGNFRARSPEGDYNVYGDAIMKSQVGKFDSFSLDRRLETEINDGDAVVKLEEYADRLLEFKKKKMTLINISQEVEFIEDSFMHKGVSHPAAVCKTDFGIAWVNRRGCYLYDGQKVNNLLEKQGRQIIKESDWDSFTTDNSIIGYVPKKRQLIVLKDCTATSAGDIYLFDMVTQSWVKGDTKFTDSQIQTNFVTDWNGDLVNAHTSGTGTVEKWDDAADTSTTMVMSTKDIDFGQPGQNKTVYKVIVTYQSGNATTNVQADYGVNGDTTFAYDFTVPELPAANGWQTAELVPDTLSESSNIKSFRLRFATDGTVPAAFEINDITIVFRVKGQR